MLNSTNEFIAALNEKGVRYVADTPTEGGKDRLTVSFGGDNMGSIRMNFFFDEDGESFSSQGSYKATYTWKDGNLIKVVTKEESTEDGEKYEYGSTCTIEYGEEKNELGQYTLGQAKVLDMEDADVFALVGMLGKASAYFPVSYTEEYYEKDSEQNYENEYSENMTYVLNTDKTIKTEYINGSPYSYSYVAIDNDSDNLKVRSLLPSDKKNLNLRSFFIRHHGRK